MNLTGGKGLPHGFGSELNGEKMGFRKVAKDRDDEEYVNYPYELLIVDADTPVFRAAKFVQEDYIIVRHIKSGNEKEFPNTTAFYGHWKKKEGGWLADRNKEREEQGKPLFKVEDFEIEAHSRLVDEIEDHIEEAVKTFDFFIGSIRGADLAPNYKLLIGGKGNYRYDIAEELPYKGNRSEKPLLFEEVREAILTKYKNKIEIVDGKEVDDACAVYGRENALNFKATGEWKYCLAFVDKDLKMIYSPYINYDKLEAGVTEPDQLECAKHYGKQLLCGDKSVDNIPGLPNLVEELRTAHGVRKGSSLGDATAIKYLATCETIKEVFQRVVEAYKAFYGTEEFMFTDYKDETYPCTWLDRLQETAILVYMNPLEEPTTYRIENTLKLLGVDYE